MGVALEESALPSAEVLEDETPDDMPADDAEQPAFAKFSDSERVAYLRARLPAHTPPEAYELGPIRVVSQYRFVMPKAGEGLLTTIGGGFLVLFCCSGGFQSIDRLPASLYGALAAAVAALAYGLWSDHREKERVKKLPYTSERFICRDGIISVDEGKVCVCRWEQVQGLYTFFLEIRTKLYGLITVGSQRSEIYTIRTHDGEEIKFSSAWPFYKRCKAILEEETQPRALANAWETYRAGGIVDFGAFHVSQGGLGGQGQFIEWPRISRVELGGGVVFITAITGDALIDQPVGNVANLQTFLTMVNDLLRQMKS